MRFFPIKPHQVLLTACRDARFVRPLHQIMRPPPAPPKGGGPNYMQTHLMFVRSPLLRRDWKRSQYNWFFPIIPRQILLPACRDARFVRPLHQNMKSRPAPSERRWTKLYANSLDVRSFSPPSEGPGEVTIQLAFPNHASSNTIAGM